MSYHFVDMPEDRLKFLCACQGPDRHRYRCVNPVRILGDMCQICRVLRCDRQRHPEDPRDGNAGVICKSRRYSL